MYTRLCLRLSNSMFFTFLMMGWTHADAGLFKCAGDNGRIVYQANACIQGRELRNLETHPPTLSVVPGLSAPDTRRPTLERDPVKRVSSETRKATRASAPTADARERKFIRTQMSEGQVLSRIGNPDLRSQGKAIKGASGSKQWTYLPSPDDPQTITTLTLVGGVVTAVDRKISR